MQPRHVAQSKHVRCIAVSLTICKNLENTDSNIQAETGPLPRYGDLFIHATLFFFFVFVVVVLFYDFFFQVLPVEIVYGLG